MTQVIDFDPMQTLGDIARYHAQARPETLALSFEGREPYWAGRTRRVN